MKTISSVEDLTNSLSSIKGKVGFVPTMGALHTGHISLVDKALKECSTIVVSVFVNPTQFNEKSDLDKYPRTLEKDSKLLAKAGVSILFAPMVSDIYPEGLKTVVDIDLGQLDKVMEGTSRPGHFEGVMQVVNRFLDIVKPDYLYMGQKDFQQFSIIDHMLKIQKSKTKLVVCPIMRESHGLAMSSRNERLSSDTREKAQLIYKVLKSIKRRKNLRTIRELKQYAIKKLSSPPFKLEYIEIADGFTLQPIEQLSDTNYAVCCIAVWADEVRLIDNIILKKD